MKWIIMSLFKAFFSVTKPHSPIYLILGTFICQVTRCGFMFDMLALMFLLSSDCLALSVFLYEKHVSMNLLFSTFRSSTSLVV